MTAAMFSLAHQILRSKIADLKSKASSSLLLRNPTTTHPNKTLDDLDDALLARILSRLPLDSLCRCRAVSRRFCNLIYARRVLHPRRLSGLFLSRHDSHHRRSRFLNFDKDASYDLSPPDLLRGALVLAASGGLLLCSRSGEDGLVGELFVCDPASRRSVALPIPKRGPLPDLSDDMCLGLAVELLPRGARPPGGLMGLPNFKVVSVHIVGGGDSSSKQATWARYGFEIFSSEQGEWQLLKKVTVDVSVKRGARHEGGVYLNGALHWLARLDGECHILALDLRQGTARKMQVPAPASRPKDGAVSWFGQSDGLLHVATIAGAHLEVWRLEDYLNVGWTRIYNEGMANSPACKGGLRPMGLTGNLVLSMTPGNQIVAYDIERKKWDPAWSTEEEEEGMGTVEAAAEKQRMVPFTLAPARWPRRNDEWVVLDEDDFSADEECHKETHFASDNIMRRMAPGPQHWPTSYQNTNWAGDRSSPS